MKFCSKCGAEREIEEFRVLQKAQDGRDYECRSCRKEEDRERTKKTHTGFVIYALCEPDYGLEKVRYIGCSTRIEVRIKEHLNCSSSKENKDKIEWIRTLKDNGFSPLLIELEICENEHEMFRREKVLIKEYRDAGHALLNKTDGGEGSGGFTHSQETKLLLSDKSKGKATSEDGRKRIKEAKMGENNPMFGKKGNPKRKLTFEDAERARELYKTEKYTYTDVAEMFDLNLSSMIRLLTNKSYRTSTKHNTQRRKLTMEQAQAIRAEYALGGVRQTELARKYGCTNTIIWLILQGKQYKC